MGMDVYGINPKIKEHSIKPDEPDSWWNCTTEEKESYFEADREYRSENPGIYFRANVWSWRPIHNMICNANDHHELGIPEKTLIHMGFNDGAGLDNQEDCSALANAMESLLKEEDDIITLEGPYEVNKDHVQEFIGFLRECGGFEVC